DLQPLAAYLEQAEFKTASTTQTTRIVSDGRTQITLHGGLLGPGFEADDRTLLDRAVPFRALGPSMYRLTAEDALLASILDQARVGYSVPYITFVDLRELLLGAPSTQGAYSHPLDAQAVRERAARWRVERALYTSTRIVADLFPETRGIADSLIPRLRPATR